MKHSEGFLKIVHDARSRINEVTVADTRDRIAANPDAHLIDVREEKHGDGYTMLHFEIADTGIGVPAETSFLPR